MSKTGKNKPQKTMYLHETSHKFKEFWRILTVNMQKEESKMKRGEIHRTNEKVNERTNTRTNGRTSEGRMGGGVWNE